MHLPKLLYLQTAQKDGNLEKLVLMLNTDRHKVQKSPMAIKVIVCMDRVNLAYELEHVSVYGVYILGFFVKVRPR